MPSLQQAPTVGQQVPPKVVMDGAIDQLKGDDSTAKRAKIARDKAEAVQKLSDAKGQQKGIKTDVVMARLYLKEALEEQEKAFAVAIALRDSVDPDGQDDRGTEYYLTLALLDIVGSSDRLHGIAKHLDAVVSSLGVEVPA